MRILWGVVDLLECFSFPGRPHPRWGSAKVRWRMDWSGGIIPSMLSRTRGWRVFLSSVNGVLLHAVLHDQFRITGRVENCWSVPLFLHQCDAMDAGTLGSIVWRVRPVTTSSSPIQSLPLWTSHNYISYHTSNEPNRFHLRQPSHHQVHLQTEFLQEPSAMIIAKT